MDFVEYPKALYKSGWANLEDSMTVYSKSEEMKARKKGYRMLDEAADAAEVAAETAAETQTGAEQVAQ
jgi:hypothetical protein